MSIRDDKPRNSFTPAGGTNEAIIANGVPVFEVHVDTPSQSPVLVQRTAAVRWTTCAVEAASNDAGAGP